MPVTVEGLEVACVGDMTEHCFPLTPGPGAPTVFVNGKPVWRVEKDKHECPQFNGPVPHKGGVVAKGAERTRFCSGYVARKSDIVVEIPGGDNKIAAGATASKSAAAGTLGDFLSEIPGIPDVLNTIAPDLLGEIDSLLGQGLSDLLNDLKNFLPEANSSVLDTLKKFWDNRDLLRELYGLKDMNLEQWLAWAASHGIRGDYAAMLSEVKEMVIDVWNLPNDLIGELASIGGTRKWDELNQVWKVRGGWVAWINENLGYLGITFGNYIISSRDWANYPLEYQHELVHTQQGYILGPAYLPSVIFGYLFGTATAFSFSGQQIHDQNPLEIWADLVSGHPNASWLGEWLQQMERARHNQSNSASQLHGDYNLDQLNQSPYLQTVQATQPAANSAQQLAGRVSQATKDHPNYCNKSVAQVANAYGNSDLDGLTANQQVKYMREHWETVTPDEAQSLANQGEMVIGGQSNPNGHGHVGIVVPAKEVPADDKKPHPPRVAGGAMNPSVRSESGRDANYVFNKNRPTEYFRPKPTPKPTTSPTATINI